VVEGHGGGVFVERVEGSISCGLSWRVMAGELRSLITAPGE